MGAILLGTFTFNLKNMDKIYICLATTDSGKLYQSKMTQIKTEESAIYTFTDHVDDNYRNEMR